MGNLKIQFNKSNFIDIHSHLLSTSDQFVPVLSSYVNIKMYSHKLIGNAKRFEFFEDQKLVALLAFYEKPNEIFISNLSVCKTHLKKGLAKELLTKLVVYSKKKHIKLEVFKLNEKAIKFYHLNDFYIKQEQDEKLILELKI